MSITDSDMQRNGYIYISSIVVLILKSQILIIDQTNHKGRDQRLNVNSMQ